MCLSTSIRKRSRSITAQIAREHGDSAADDQIAMISNVWQLTAKKFPAEFKRKGRINPTYRIKRHYKHDGEGHLVWPDEVIEAFDTGCPWHLKFVRMGLHYTGQRGGDVVKMKWTDFDGKRIYVVQEKTGKKLWLNCPKPLLDVLRREQKRTNREYIFHHAYDAPFASAQTLSHAIRNRLEALGINPKPTKKPGVKGYTMHGLRKNAGMELAEAGAEVLEIMSVLGHKTSPKMADVLLRTGTAVPHERKRGGEVGCRARKEGGQESAKFCARLSEQTAKIFPNFAD